MADFKLDGRMKVKSLKENFKKCFGASLRVYKNESCKGGFADENATLQHEGLCSAPVSAAHSHPLQHPGVGSAR